MSIASSTIVRNDLQADGRRWITERHTDNVGQFWFRTYLAAAGLDTAAELITYAASLSDNLVVQEIATNLINIYTFGSLATPMLNYSTVAQNAAAIRVIYAIATDSQAMMIGDFLNTLTNAQLAAAFNITTGQAATLRTNKLAPAAALVASVRASTGQ